MYNATYRNSRVRLESENLAKVIFCASIARKSQLFYTGGYYEED